MAEGEPESIPNTERAEEDIIVGTSVVMSESESTLKVNPKGKNGSKRETSTKYKIKAVLLVLFVTAVVVTCFLFVVPSPKDSHPSAITSK